MTFKFTEDQAVTLERQIEELRAARAARNVVAGSYRAAHQRLLNAEHALHCTMSDLKGPPAAEALSRVELPDDVGVRVEIEPAESDEDAAEENSIRIATQKGSHT